MVLAVVAVRCLLEFTQERVPLLLRCMALPRVARLRLPLP